MAADQVAEHFLAMQKMSESQSPFVSQLHLLFHDDWVQNTGLVRAIVGDLPSLLENPYFVLPGLRLAAGLNFLVLTNQEKKLAEHFPPQQLRFNEQTKAEVLSVLQKRRDVLKKFCLSAPQTNEVARSSVLFCGIAFINSQQPVRLLELGCSAGLNLFCDRYSYPQLDYKAEDVTIEFAWVGPHRLAGPVKPPRVISRKGCDLNPLNLRSDAEFYQSLSYIWPDQSARVNLFTAAARALRGRAETGENLRESAEVFLERELKKKAPNTATIVMHSVFLQYPPLSVRQRIAELIEKAGAEASPSAPLYWLRFEMAPVLDGTAALHDSKFLLDLVTFTGGPPARQTLAEVHHHAKTIQWLTPTPLPKL